MQNNYLGATVQAHTLSYIVTRHTLFLASKFGLNCSRMNLAISTLPFKQLACNTVCPLCTTEVSVSQLSNTHGVSTAVENYLFGEDIH